MSRNQRYYRKKAIKNLIYRCNRCGYVPPERFEKKRKWMLHVHHKDGNRNNNKLRNLELLCTTCHKIEHGDLKTDTQINKELKLQLVRFKFMFRKKDSNEIFRRIETHNGMALPPG